MFEISVEGGFCATHRLRLAGGATEPMHGHDWRVTVRLACAELDGFGMVADFEAVRSALDEICEQLHHRHLNDHAWFVEANPTAENVGRMIGLRMADIKPWGSRCVEVTVTEAPGCRATFRLPMAPDVHRDS